MYEVKNYETWKVEDEGERTKLANFAAQVVKEIRYTDGAKVDTYLVISGEQPNGKKAIALPEITVSANDFAGMGWAMQCWGVRTYLQPGSGVKDDMRVAILQRSKPEVVTIYKHTGWSQIDGKPVYLHAGGGIGAKGNDPSVKVELPNELRHYELVDDPKQLKAAVQATLSLVTLAAPTITWPLLAGTVAPLYGTCDFGLHLSGRTGTFKSELMSLFQSCYGSKMDSRHLPGSWSSTPNALEAQCYLAKNAPFTIDDFVPQGSSYQIRAYQATADKIFRAQGNQAGRARLTDTSNLQSTMYPRGIVFSTGEDTPEGHSVRARLMILEIAPGDITPDALTAAQKKRDLYPVAMGGLAKELANKPVDLTPRKERLRQQYVDIGHSRTPSTIAHLQAAIEYYLAFASKVGAISSSDYQELGAEAQASIKAAGMKQEEYLETADPCEVWINALRTAMGANLAHVRTTNGGVPLRPTELGWTQEGIEGETPRYKSHGPCIGWLNWHEDELYIDSTIGFTVVGKQIKETATTKQTLIKRLKEGGTIIRSEDNRNRNTLRIMAEGHVRTTICLRLSATLESQEVPDDGEDVVSPEEADAPDSQELASEE